MIGVMDLALLLERLRDAFVAAKDSLLGSDGALTYHFVNDIAITIHVRFAPLVQERRNKHPPGLGLRATSLSGTQNENIFGFYATLSPARSSPYPRVEYTFAEFTQPLSRIVTVAFFLADDERGLVRDVHDERAPRHHDQGGIRPFFVRTRGP